MRSAQTDSVFRVLHAMTLRERRNRRKAAQALPGRRLSKALYLTEVTLSIISVLIAALVHFDILSRTNLAWRWGSLGAISLAYLVILLHPFIEFYIHRRTLTKAVRNPLGLLLGNAKATAQVDRLYVGKLARSTKEALELVLLEVKAERDAYLKRTAVITGPVDKLGLAPGLLATVLAISNLPVAHSALIEVLAYAGPFWFLMGTASAVWIAPTLDRQVCVLELALAQNKAGTEKSESTPGRDVSPSSMSSVARPFLRNRKPGRGSAYWAMRSPS
jgi:hypothetical protein